MSTSEARFASLLTEAVKRISIQEDKRISLVQDELGYALGRSGGTPIEYWRKGHIPARAAVEGLAREITARLNPGSAWIDRFFESAGYPNHAVLPGGPPRSDMPPRILADASRQPEQVETLYRGSAPPYPTLMVGRTLVVDDLRGRLRAAASGSLTQAPVQATIVVRGWPGVGKTTLAAALANDSHIIAAFPDGVLWASLGPAPDLLAELAVWERALRVDESPVPRTLEEASLQLTALLRGKRVFVVVDDVWEARHAIPFRVGGRGCALLITTRLPAVAAGLAPTPGDIFNLPALTDGQSMELLRQLAPIVVAQYPEHCQELVRELEGLPLALQVAGRLLHAEMGFGWGVRDLLQELHEGVNLLEAEAPADLADLAQETIPTVATLLKRSTDRLDPHTRECFAALGVYAPKPATLDFDAMQASWDVEDPRPIARRLVERGLLEPVGSARFQMHALLVMLAKSLLPR